MTNQELLDKVIEVVKNSIQDNCPDHTPFRGMCVTCRRRHNFELIRNPDKLLERLEILRNMGLNVTDELKGGEII